MNTFGSATITQWDTSVTVLKIKFASWVLAAFQIVGRA